jgi:hypothetical protein
MDETRALRENLLWLLRGGHAHPGLDAVLAGWPPALRGEKPAGQPHTGWRLLEHLRIALHDILEFSRDPDWVSPAWPEGYWPEGDAPPDDDAWERSRAAVQTDLAALEALVADDRTDLFRPFPWGDGQTLIREVLLVADHGAWHLGQLVLLRRVLGLPATGEGGAGEGS